MIIQIRSHGKLHSDDFVLLFACLNLIASETLLYTVEIEKLYWLVEVSYNLKNHPEILAMIMDDLGTYLRLLKKIQQTDFASTTLNWISIFAVKICFLLFFYPFISRLRKWLLAWRVIFGITIFAGAICMSSSFIACSHFGHNVCKFRFASTPYNSPYKKITVT